MLDAARHFDPVYGTKLLTYATPVMEAALSDYAAQYSSSLSIPISRYNQLRRVAYLCTERWDSSDVELVKVVCGELNVSAKVAGTLIKECRTMCSPSAAAAIPPLPMTASCVGHFCSNGWRRC